MNRVLACIAFCLVMWLPPAALAQALANATAAAQASILAMADKGEISGGQAKEIFEIVLKTGRDPAEIADAEGLKQVSDTGAIEKLVDETLAENSQSIADFKAGKDRALGFMVGQIMKKSRGKANPAMVNEMLLKKLKE